MSTRFKDGISRRSVRLEAVLARLEALVNWEKRSRGGVGGMEVSLAPMQDLCARLGSPEKSFQAVHVAGSKGKGTTAAGVAAAFARSGRRVALYTSPHLERVCERLSIGGEEVEEERLAVALERALAAREAALEAGSGAQGATWFDVLTAGAFLVCAEEGVEFAVVECGLGGRLDSTNVVFGAVAAITNVYLEHTEVLGSTRAAIAVEKAGIVKPGTRVVVGALSAEDEAAAVVARIAAERGAPCTRVEFAPEDSLERRNRRLVSAILAEARIVWPQFALDPTEAAAPALAGRAERRVVGATRVVLDGAHVPESLVLLRRDLAQAPELARPPVVVLGMGREKNAEGLLKALQGWADRVLCSTVGEGPYRGAEELAGLARELDLDARAVPDPAAALVEAADRAGSEGWVLVTGSLHLVGALRRHTSPPQSTTPRPRC